MIYQTKHFLLFAILLGGSVWFLTDWMRGVSFDGSAQRLARHEHTVVAVGGKLSTAAQVRSGI